MDGRSESQHPGKEQTVADLGTDATVDEIANSMRALFPGSAAHTRGTTELTLRQAKAQLDACAAQVATAAAQERAAKAAIEAAHHARRNATYMLASAIAAASSAFISLISTIYTLSQSH
jgi:hypothetical protein